MPSASLRAWTAAAWSIGEEERLVDEAVGCPFGLLAHLLKVKVVGVGGSWGACPTEPDEMQEP